MIRRAAAAGDEVLFSIQNIIPPIIRVIAGPGSRDLISDKPGKAASRSRTGIDPEPPKRYISVADDSLFLISHLPRGSSLSQEPPWPRRS